MSTPPVTARPPRRWLKVLPEMVLTLATFVTVLSLAPMSQGIAFPAPPPELMSLAKGGYASLLDACEPVWLSAAGLMAPDLPYFGAGLGPDWGGPPILDRTGAILLAAAISGMVAMNLAVVRHVRDLVDGTRR